MTREVRWQVELGKPCNLLAMLGDGRLMAGAGDNLIQLDGRGGVTWRTGFAGEDLVEGSNATILHAPVLLPDGQLLLGVPGHDAVVLSRSGQVAMRWKTQSAVRGRPLAYVNDAFGVSPRVAFAAEAVYSGDPAKDPNFRIPLPSPALCGPLAIPAGIDQILVVGTLAGTLIGIEESSRKLLWTLDLRATDIGQLHPVGTNSAVALLDGSRLVRVSFSTTEAAPRWSQSLADAAVGEPAIAGGVVYLSVSRQVVRVGIEGALAPSLSLPAQASCSPAAADDLVAVGCKDGSLVIFQAGKPFWTTPCGSPPTSLIIVKGMVIAGLENGRVLAFPL